MSVVATPIPERAVLLHVGLPKTGTTALQNAAARSRAALLENGVSYPGSAHNHSWASFAVARRRRGWGTGPGKADVPDISHWTALVSQVQAEPERRILISHEYFAEHKLEVCERVVRDLDRDVHVVFTMRNQADILSSAWQEYLKNGITQSFDEWLETVLRHDGERSAFRSFDKRTALSDAVEKWAGVVGADKVTVVALDKARPSLLTDTFEQLLALPPRLLGEVRLSGARANRSMSAAEAELVRSMNHELRGNDDVDWELFRGLYRLGAITAMLQHRTPGPDEARIVPPRWAAEAAADRARGHVERIKGLGVQIVGPIDDLAVVGPSLAKPAPAPALVPLDAAREAGLGIFWSAAKQIGALESNQRPVAPESTDSSLRSQVRAGMILTDGVSSRHLALALLGRGAARVRRRRRRKGTR